MEPYILTYGGGRFDYASPESGTYTIEDIAHALSNICRFGGHTREFYSVAQHCVLATSFIPNTAEASLSILLHDASEAFMCDIMSPLKQLLPDYRKLESRAQSAIFHKFGIIPDHDKIRAADLRMLATEKRDLMPHDPQPWPMLEGVKPFAAVIEPWSPKQAEKAFLDAFDTMLHVAQGYGVSFDGMTDEAIGDMLLGRQSTVTAKAVGRRARELFGPAAPAAKPISRELVADALNFKVDKAFPP